jgi:predicted nuclease of restriction endonuclease-like (RecB) superfamily
MSEERDETTVKQVLSQFDPTSRSYVDLLASLKSRIQQARTKAALSINRELTALYWAIGRQIVEAQNREGWGTSMIDRLAHDLQSSVPSSRGLSPRNLWRMRAFYHAYPACGESLPQHVADLARTFLPRAVAEIPWGHNIALIEKVKDPQQRLWYAAQTLKHGWSRAVLVHQIESDLYARQGEALTNFDHALPAPQSELARELMKDPYNLDFLGLADDISERELEKSLLDHLKEFLLELGKGFAFMGSQYHLEVGDQDYYVDLLFYNTILRAYVVIDLKVEAFKPEFAGKMNFYLNAVEDRLRHPDDQSPIGLILCKERHHVTVEFSLRGMNQPMGVSEYRLLPEDLQATLPSPEEWRAELESVAEDLGS